MLSLPEDKRTHRFIPMEIEDYYYPTGRSDAYTVIEIKMIAGRQQDIIKTLFSEIEKQLAIAPVNIEITFKQQPAYCWRYRGINGDESILTTKLKHKKTPAHRLAFSD